MKIIVSDGWQIDRFGSDAQQSACISITRNQLQILDSQVARVIGIEQCTQLQDK